jgi:hypothetical protein
MGQSFHVSEDAEGRVRNLVFPFALAAFFAAAVFLVPPRGEFPINDDWDYFATVGDLLRYGEIRLSDWPGMSLVAQVYWGGLFAKLFGLSYMTLRLSVITLAFAGALALYYWARAIERTRVESLFLGLLYATSPLVFSLSYSFMTDVPGASLMVICLLVQAHCFRRGGVLLYLLAGVMAGLAYLVRQIAVLPALVLAASLLPALFQRQARVRDFLALTIPLVLIINGHRFWLTHVHGLPYQAATGRFQFLAPETMLLLLFLQVLALCVYLAPLLVCLVGRRASAYVWRSRGAGLVVVAVLFGVLVLMGLAGAELPPPYTQYLGDSYLGFEAFVGATLRGPRIAVGSNSLGMFSLVNAIGLVSLSVGAGFLFLDLRARWTGRASSWLPLSPGDQAGLCGLVLLGLLVGQEYPFDRYLVPIIPLLAMFLLSRLPRGRGLMRSPLSWVLLAVYGIVSVMGTQDYLVRAQARWRAVDSLLQSGIPPEDIGAGFEHAALYCFAPRYRQPVRVRPYLLDLPETERVARLKAENPSFVWMQPREYEVAYDPVVGAEPVAVFPWQSWFRSGGVLVYHRPGRARRR